MTANRVYFTKEKIIEAAFKLLKENGWARVTVRNIARELGSSTMPIYSSGFSIEEIEWELKARVWRLIQEYQAKPYTQDKLLNLAVGFVMFAKEEPRLHRFLYVERPVPEPEEEDKKKQFAAAYPEREDLRRALRVIPEGIQHPLMLKTMIFTQGLASIMASGQAAFSEKKIIALLEEAGGAFYTFEAQEKKGGDK